jgi:hypothetical protein
MGVGDVSTYVSQASLIHLSIISAICGFPARGNGSHPGAHLPADLGESLMSEIGILFVRSLILHLFRYIVELHNI